jgi:hypothetical protein
VWVEPHAVDCGPIVPGAAAGMDGAVMKLLVDWRAGAPADYAAALALS